MEITDMTQQNSSSLQTIPQSKNHEGYESSQHSEIN